MEPIIPTAIVMIPIGYWFSVKIVGMPLLVWVVWAITIAALVAYAIYLEKQEAADMQQTMRKNNGTKR